MAKHPISPVRIQQSNFDILSLLKDNNNREWFSLHKAEFEKEQADLENFAEALLGELNKHDLIETVSGKKSLYRVYRDVRFSKDKTPYKTHWSGSFKRATKYRRGGYYFHIEAGNSFIAGGFWGPSKEDLKLIRDGIDFDAAPLRAVLNDPLFLENFGDLKGEQLKRMPKGFPADHDDIDLLRYKQFLLIRRFSDAEVLVEDFLMRVNATFTAMRPFFDYMSEVLTTDRNGLEI